MPLRKIILFFFCCAAAFGIQAQCYQTFLDEGRAYARQGKWDKAIASYKDAKQCQSDKPANSDSVLNGLINEAQKQKKATIDRQKAKDEQQKREKAETQQREQDRIRREAAQREDDNAWDIAQSAQSAAACRTYRQKYPNGRHTQAALQCEKDYADDDKDGVVNKNDRCPSEPGPASNKGCKEEKIPLPTMIYITGGSFSMGSNDGNKDEKPIHQVNIKNYYLSRYEVTNAEFCAFLNDKGNQSEGGISWIDLNGKYQDEKCRIQQSGSQFRVEGGYDRYPVIYVSWYGAKAYCQWLADRTGEPYRLPTEAEWEYAAGGGSNKRSKWAGTNESSQLYRYANFCDSKCKETRADKNQTDDHIYTAPVGSFLANALGLHDMSGNVWEWCADNWHISYDGAPNDGSVWMVAGNPKLAVLRGGSWKYDINLCQSTNRFGVAHYDRYNEVGIRVAKSEEGG